MKTITEQYRGNIPLDTKYKIENVRKKWQSFILKNNINVIVDNR